MKHPVEYHDHETRRQRWAALEPALEQINQTLQENARIIREIPK